MFYYWAKQVISYESTPLTMYFMSRLIWFFKLFQTSNLANNEMLSMFWQDENTDGAKAHIKAYKNDIEELQWRYDDQESSYEQHMQDRRKLNTKLSTLSHKYSDNEPYTMSVNEASTD